MMGIRGWGCNVRHVSLDKMDAKIGLVPGLIMFHKNNLFSEVLGIMSFGYSHLDAHHTGIVIPFINQPECRLT